MCRPRGSRVRLVNREPSTAERIRPAIYVVGIVVVCSIAYAYGVATDDSGFRGDTGGNDLAPINGFIHVVGAFLLCAVVIGVVETSLRFRDRRASRLQSRTLTSTTCTVRSALGMGQIPVDTGDSGPPQCRWSVLE